MNRNQLALKVIMRQIDRSPAAAGSQFGALVGHLPLET